MEQVVGRQPAVSTSQVRNPSTKTEVLCPGKVKLCACVNKVLLLDILASPNVKAIAGGLMLYGSVTWWMGGSGLIIAGVGAGVWLISTMASLYVGDCSFEEAAASIGWATPVGWTVLALWNLSWGYDMLNEYCCELPCTDDDV